MDQDQGCLSEGRASSPCIPIMTLDDLNSTNGLKENGIFLLTFLMT